MVPWLGLCASTAEGTGSIPCQATKIPHTTEQLSSGHNYWSSPTTVKACALQGKIPCDTTYYKKHEALLEFSSFCVSSVCVCVCVCVSEREIASHFVACVATV